MKTIEMDGKRFGKLTVLSYHDTQRKRRRFLCQCDCGKITVAGGADLRGGAHQSCGCIRLPNLRAALKARAERKVELAAQSCNEAITY